MNVEPMGLMEHREFAESAVDVVNGLGPILRLDVDFDRRAQVARCLGIRADDRLRAEDDQLLVLGDVARCTNRVLQLVAVHLDASSRSMSRSLSSKERTAKNGELCLSRAARELDDTRKLPRRSGE